MLEQPSGKPYLICYFLHKKLFREEFAIAQKIAKGRGLELKVINARFGPNSFRKGTVFDAGPGEFVNFDCQRFLYLYGFFSWNALFSDFP